MQVQSGSTQLILDDKSSIKDQRSKRYLIYSRRARDSTLERVFFDATCRFRRFREH